MLLEIDRENRDLLIELVDARLSDIGSEIRRCMNVSFQQSLKDKKRILQQIQGRLHEAEGDVTS